MQYPHRARLFARTSAGFGCWTAVAWLTCLDRPRPAA